METEVRNIQSALASIGAYWQPHRLASVNDYDVKVVKIKDEFVWHSHPDTDELFLILQGRLTIQLRDRDVVLGEQDVFVVPAGSSTARRPRARCTPCSSNRAAR